MLTMTSEEIVFYVCTYVDNTKCSLAMVDSTTYVDICQFSEQIWKNMCIHMYVRIMHVVLNKHLPDEALSGSPAT